MTESSKKEDRVYYFRNPGTKRGQKLSEKRPSSQHVADAVVGGHITSEEAKELNPAYTQRIGGRRIPKPVKEKKQKEKKPRAKKSAPVEQPSPPQPEIRVVNGREFRVTKLDEDKAATKRVRTENIRMNYRAKEGRY